MDEIVVFDRQRDRLAERLAVANARQYLDGIGLDFHSAAASVALLATPKLMIDHGNIDRQAGRNSFDDSNKGLSVRLACCCEFEEHTMIFITKAQRTQRESR